MQAFNPQIFFGKCLLRNGLFLSMAKIVALGVLSTFAVSTYAEKINKLKCSNDEIA